MSMALKHIINILYSNKVKSVEISALGSTREGEKMAQEKMKYCIWRRQRKNRKRKLQIAEVHED